MRIHRQFAALNEGDIHYRHAGLADGVRPLLMLHPSPASSRALLPVMATIASERPVIAPDTLGNGDSCPPSIESPDLGYYADSMLRLMDTLGIEEFDVYGSHTGSHVGIEIALQAGHRLKSLTMHGVALMDADEQEAFLANYAPIKAPDDIGGHLNWAWHFIRDQMIFYPHFRKDAAHIRAGGNLSANYLHELTVDVLKNIRHYHKTYHAVFRHAVLTRLAAVSQPIALLAHVDEPLNYAVEPIRKACTSVEVLTLADESPAVVAKTVNRFIASNTA
ncbi:MAG: alpha/beta fold hydrolase [Pseudomonadota bacterium]